MFDGSNEKCLILFCFYFVQCWSLMPDKDLVGLSQGSVKFCSDFQGILSMVCQVLRPLSCRAIISTLSRYTHSVFVLINPFS